MLALVAATLAGCAARQAAYPSPFHAKLAAEGAELMRVIELDELQGAASARAIMDVEGFLRQSGVEVHGSGDRAYVRGHELLEVCGPGCDPAAGLGELLADFVVASERR